MHRPLSLQLTNQWIDAGIHYKSFSVSGSLSPWVNSIWQMQLFDSIQPCTAFPILPDGRSRLVFAWDETNCKAWFSSPTTSAYRETLNSHTQYLGFEFHHGRASDLCCTPMYELTNTLENLFPEIIYAQRTEEWIDKLNTSDPLQFLSDWLQKRLQENRHEIHYKQQTNLAIQRLLNPNESIDQIALSLNTNRRQLLRGFQRYVGLSPSKLKRILRAQAALSKLRSSNNHIADVACWANYHDQAHMTHDFRALFQMSPSEFQAI